MRRKIMRVLPAVFCAALLCCTAAFAGDNSELFPRYEADYYKTGNPSAIASGQIAMRGKPEEIVLKRTSAENGPIQQTTKLTKPLPAKSRNARDKIYTSGGEDEQKARIEKTKQMIVESCQQPQEENHYIEKEIAEQWREEHRQEQAVENIIRVINMFQR